MNLKRGRFLFLVIVMSILALAVAVGGCRKAPAEQPPVVAPEPAPVVKTFEPELKPAPMPEPELMPEMAPVMKAVELGDVFFAFDKFNLTQESRNILAENAEVLLDNDIKFKGKVIAAELAGKTRSKNAVPALIEQLDTDIRDLRRAAAHPDGNSFTL